MGPEYPRIAPARGAARASRPAAGGGGWWLTRVGRGPYTSSRPSPVSTAPWRPRNPGKRGEPVTLTVPRWIGVVGSLLALGLTLWVGYRLGETFLVPRLARESAA